MKLPLVLTLCFVLTGSVIFAQEKWSLERCILVALDKNLGIQQAKITRQGHIITGKQLRMERIPNLNASSNFGVTFGRFVNPATNDFETENALYQSMGINSGVMLFNGYRTRNAIRQNDYFISASEEDLRQTQNDLALDVALAYLNVLFAYENQIIAADRAELSRRQLDNLDKMIQAGTRPENDRYDIIAQIAVDEQGIISAQNNIDINLLALKQHMLMDVDELLEIERPQIDINSLEALENQSFEAVFAAALSSQPQIQAAGFREKASETGIALARSQMIPSLSIGGNIGSNWSDLAKIPADYVTQRIPQHGIFINGEQASFEVESQIPTAFHPIPYGRQLDNNIGYGVGATLSIPIFNNYAGKASVEKAKLNFISTSIQTDQIKQTLKTNIQNALTSAKASRKSLEGAEASALAARFAMENADRRAAQGTLNNFEYLSARNRLDAAENNLLIARYDYFFNIKVIEYYMGRGIRIN